LFSSINDRVYDNKSSTNFVASVLSWSYAGRGALSTLLSLPLLLPVVLVIFTDSGATSCADEENIALRSRPKKDLDRSVDNDDVDIKVVVDVITVSLSAVTDAVPEGSIFTVDNTEQQQRYIFDADMVTFLRAVVQHVDYRTDSATLSMQLNCEVTLL
jgi:hypothetical protein